uniref:Uncharacterized protein n=1 Tax=Candidatus Kentrum sp. FM TaxID=2126340 RepID=A0A450TTQ5_9GAMM|nr:MAG: hypothetical protein BECKFM1743A_GA0114220_106252 [Candidatus Kentron sp. FM]VFJ72198.1 MAG: hypothetical protein BECKFM1743C_GA0114222_106392 [Candidatus Kentron sp. FM]VFK19691.1 MAG: hypothetical protein BECKFM1743B_GA0114221_106372 [Candidatus Kentron sp. FM]
MWHYIIKLNDSTLDDADLGPIEAFWISPEGGEVLLLTRERTIYWSLPDNRALWTLRERSGGDGISPDGRLYRDLASGLFYPLLGAHGGRQRREHPAGGRISVDQQAGTVTVTGSDGKIQHLPDGERCHDPRSGDWLAAGFCESGDRLFVAGPRGVVVYGRGTGE